MRAPPAGVADVEGKPAARHAGVGGKIKLRCVQGGELWCLAGRGLIVSVEVMGAKRARPKRIYEGGVGPRLEDVGEGNAGGVVTVSQERERAFPSSSEQFRAR